MAFIFEVVAAGDLMPATKTVSCPVPPHFSHEGKQARKKLLQKWSLIDPSLGKNSNGTWSLVRVESQG